MDWPLIGRRKTSDRGGPGEPVQGPGAGALFAETGVLKTFLRRPSGRARKCINQPKPACF
eukprot:5172665-Lingulodinium_polyedra.AAC.1